MSRLPPTPPWVDAAAPLLDACCGTAEARAAVFVAEVAIDIYGPTPLPMAK